jgi:outer membrane biosynthesis protein TonB
MQSKGTRLSGLALTLLSALVALAFVAGPAQARCEICDQYTLDIPEPQDNGGSSGGGDSSGGDSSGGEPAPAPVPVTPTAPAPVSPTEPVPTTTDAKPDRDKPKPKPEPEYVSAPDLAKAIAASYATAEDNAPAQSTPLSYDEGDSTSEAALAGLGSPGTAVLLVVLLAAGAAVAFGRRRSA